MGDSMVERMNEPKLLYSDIFHSSGDMRRSGEMQYENFVDLIEKDIIQMNIRLIEPLKTPLKEFVDVGGGENHRDIAKVMWDIQKKRMKGNPLTEQWCGGKRVDIYDETNDTIIECGDTNPDALRFHLEYCQTVVVAPYRRGLDIDNKILEKEWKQKRIIYPFEAYFFSCRDKEVLKKYNRDLQLNMFKGIMWKVNNK